MLLEEQDIEQKFKQMLEESQSNLFQPFKEPDYMEKEFDFEINPDHFHRWLIENMDKDKIVLSGDYTMDVGNACEYSCLYIAMMNYGRKLKGQLLIHCGNFGFWGHYWMGYRIDGVEYYIDLTLQQFIKTAPKLAVSKAFLHKNGYNKISIGGEAISTYIKRQKAFRYYINPHKL